MNDTHRKLFETLITPDTWVLPKDPKERLALLERVILDYGSAQELQHRAHQAWKVAQASEPSRVLRADALLHEGRRAVYSAAADLVGVAKALQQELEDYTDALRDQVAKAPGGLEYEAAQADASMADKIRVRLKDTSGSEVVVYCGDAPPGEWPKVGRNSAYVLSKTDAWLFQGSRDARDVADVYSYPDMLLEYQGIKLEAALVELGLVPRPDVSRDDRPKCGPPSDFQFPAKEGG